MPTYNTQKTPVTTATIVNDGVPIGTATIHDPIDPTLPRDANYAPVFGNSEVSTDQIQCYSLRKTVMFLCGIDIFFGLLYSFYNPYFIIPTFIAGIGYVGTKKYNSCIVLTYLIYITLDWMTKLGIYISNAIMQHPDTLDPAARTWWWIFIIISTLVDIWISKIVWKYWRCLRDMSVLELTELKTRNLGQYYYVYW